MPLHAEREAGALHLERLRQVVDRGPARDREPLADPVHALVMVRLGGVDGGACHPRRERAVGEADVVVGVVEAPQDAAVVAVPEVVGQVLDERAPRATLRSCMPRQIPRNGMSRSIARLTRASSKASRSGTVPGVSWCGSAP